MFYGKAFNRKERLVQAARDRLRQGLERHSVPVHHAGFGAPVGPEVKLVVGATRAGDRRQIFGWDHKARFMEASLWEDPGQRHQKGRWGGDKVRPVDENVPVGVGVIELSGLDLDSER